MRGRQERRPWQLHRPCRVQWRPVQRDGLRPWLLELRARQDLREADHVYGLQIVRGGQGDVVMGPRLVCELPGQRGVECRGDGVHGVQRQLHTRC